MAMRSIPTTWATLVAFDGPGRDKQAPGRDLHAESLSVSTARLGLRRSLRTSRVSRSGVPDLSEWGSGPVGVEAANQSKYSSKGCSDQLRGSSVAAFFQH